MIVADFIREFLIQKGVKQVFGFQGGAILKLLDAFVETGEIQFIQGFNEQASSFAADAQGRIRNDIGVAIATSGPGATNLINGLANAYFDSIPTLFITGQDYLTNVKGRKLARQNGFQDLDIVNIVKSITKYAVTIEDEKQIQYELEKAYYMATSGRKGSVLIDIPIDIQFKDIDITTLASFHVPVEENTPFNLDKIISMLEAAQKPVILAGGGIRLADAREEFIEFARNSQIPVVCTLNGLDVFEDNIGFAGLHGNSVANLTVLNADVLIVLGSRLGQRHVGKKIENYTGAQIIHIDADPCEINRSVAVDINVCVDLERFFVQFNQEKIKYPEIDDWKKQIVIWQSKFNDNVLLNKSQVDPVQFVRDVSRFFTNNTVIIGDVGQNQMWLAQGFKVKANQRLLNSSGLGSMGYSLPAAIGASYLSSDPVVSFTGDGGLQMNLQELNTLALLRNNVKCIVFNNNTLGMMREVQKRYFQEHYIGSKPQEFTCPDLAMLAQTFNLGYQKIGQNSDVELLEAAFKDNQPYLIDVRVQFDSLLLNRYDDPALWDSH